MRAILVCVLVIALCSCSSKDDSSHATQPAPEATSKNEQPREKKKMNPPESEEAIDSRTCPYIEMSGMYRVTKVDCSIDRREDIDPDLSVVPMAYVISSKGETGELELIFEDGLGVERSRIKFEFPRLATITDFKRNGTQCGNTRDSRSLSQSCPGPEKTCTYSFSEENGKFIGVYFILKDDKFLGCRSEISRVR